MANEAILRDRLEHPIDFTIPNAQAVEKGSLMSLHDPRICSGARIPAQVIAGIAAREKVANDGRTQLAVFRKGIFDMVASGAITIGAPVMSASDGTWTNTIKQALGIAASGAVIIGHSLETAADAERVQIFLNVGAGTPL